MNYCKKLCNECPFSNQSIPGWLAEYDLEDFKQMMDADVMFPCHKLMTEDNLSIEDAQEAIRHGEMKVCRGYLESMIKSAKMPKYNKVLLNYRQAVKEEGLSEESMSLTKFREYHSTFLK